jgi:hypothetical protein
MADITCESCETIISSGGIPGRFRLKGLGQGDILELSDQEIDRMGLVHQNVRVHFPEAEATDTIFACSAVIRISDITPTQPSRWAPESQTQTKPSPRQVLTTTKTK